jgi:hypothetical protein
MNTCTVSHALLSLKVADGELWDVLEIFQVVSLDAKVTSSERTPVEVVARIPGTPVSVLRVQLALIEHSLDDDSKMSIPRKLDSHLDMPDRCGININRKTP